MRWILFLIKQQNAALLKIHSTADVNLINQGVAQRTANLKNTSGELLPTEMTFLPIVSKSMYSITNFAYLLTTDRKTSNANLH